MNIKEFRRLSNKDREEELNRSGVFIDVYNDPYNDIKIEYFKNKIMLYSLYSFYVYCYKTKLGSLSIISIQGVTDYLEPDNLKEWLKV